ncbi:unnamed protein product [Aphanomyces euteiches]
MTPRNLTPEPRLVVKATTQPEVDESKLVRPNTVLIEDISTIPDGELMRRGHNAAKLVLRRCRQMPQAISKAKSDGLSVVETRDIPATLDDVLEIFSRDSQLGFQAYLLRAFGDLLAEATSVRRARPTTFSRSKSEDALAGSTAAVKRFQFDEKKLFRSTHHELVVLDFVQKLHEKAFVRAFKSLDVMPSNAKLVPVSNILFGFHMDEIHRGCVQVSFFGQHIGKKNAFAHLIIDRLAASLELLATAVWRRRLSKHAVPKRKLSSIPDCYLCRGNVTRWTRTMCRICSNVVCPDCSEITEAESKLRVLYELRVCAVCLAQTQANLPINSRRKQSTSPTELTSSGHSDSGLPRINENVGEDQTRHGGISHEASRHRVVEENGIGRRVKSHGAVPNPPEAQVFSTPRGVTGNYHAPSYWTNVESDDSVAKLATPLENIDVSSRAEQIRQHAFSNAAVQAKLEVLCDSLAARLECRYAYVTLIYWGGFTLKASNGEQVPRISHSCELNMATLGASPDPLVILNAGIDPKFASCSRVTGPEGIRFYMALTLQTADGIELGTVAVADPFPRTARQLSQSHLLLLRSYATNIAQEIEEGCL